MYIRYLSIIALQYTAYLEKFDTKKYEKTKETQKGL